MSTQQLILGIDEAGRGALAGPVVVAGVILDPDNPIKGLNDSKKLTPKQREKLAEEIYSKAKYYSVGITNNFDIDEYNILVATKMATSDMFWEMAYKDSRKGIYHEDVMQALIKIDGNINLLEWDGGIPNNFELIPQGDSKVPEIMAASIIAKVVRDEYMTLADIYYKGYDFAKSKGYPSPKHIEAIKQLGPCQIHRKTFKKVKEYVQNN